MIAGQDILLVTGTDTGVGKTFVSRGILRACRRRGLAVRPLKLVETGCQRGESGLVGADAEALAQAAQDVAPDPAALRFELPAAPVTAARAAGVTLTFAALFERLDVALQGGEALVLEGAGGFLAPLAKEGTFGDFAQEIGARVVIVARDALGTLNHTLLTLEAVKRRGLTLEGVVLNASGPELCALEHRAELEGFTRYVRIFGPLGWCGDVTDDAAADAVIAAGLSPELLFPRLAEKADR